jgi:hypothetical protein
MKGAAHWGPGSVVVWRPTAGRTKAEMCAEILRLQQ